MSFLAEQPCVRPILLPIGISNRSPSPSAHQDDVAKPTYSSNWRATTHSFVGTTNRVVPPCWPLEKFNDDPSQIPDDPKYNTDYNPDSAKPRPNGTFRMFQDAQKAGQVPPPRIVVKRYIPTQISEQNPDPITLLVIPGMGSAKELWEPFIDQLLSSPRKLQIAEIWSIDMPLSGQTPLLNSPGYMYGNEKDIARDVMLFVTSYLPLEPGLELPFELSARPLSLSKQVHTRQHLHVVAHSLGAQSAMLVASHAPLLFASMTVFDPAMIPDGKIRQGFCALPKATLCTNIGYRHKSQEAIKEELRKNRRTRGWDQRIVDAFAEHSVIEDRDGLRLTAHPRLEWALYYDQETPTHCYDRLVDLKTPLNAIMPAKPFAVPPKMLERDMGHLKQKTRLTWVPKTTHQLPFESLDQCVDLTIAWLLEISIGQRTRL